MALKFGNPIVAGTVLTIPAIQSPNWPAGGWIIRADGSAVFQSITIPPGSGGARVFYGSTEPASPNPGDVWFDTSDGLRAHQWTGTAARDQSAAPATVFNVATITLTWATPPAAGSKVLVSVCSATGPTVVSVTDNGVTPATFSQDAAASAFGAFVDVYIYRADDITLPPAGPYEVTVTFTANTFGFATGASYLGVATGAPAAQNSASGTSGSVTTGSITPPAAGALALAIMTDDSGLNPESITLTAAGWTDQGTFTNGGIEAGAVADIIAPDTAAQAATWTLGDSPDWLALIATYGLGWQPYLVGAGALVAGLVVAGIIDGTTVNAATFNGSTFNGTDWIEDSVGSFYYAGTPGPTTLALSISPNGGTDPFGTSVLNGVQAQAAGGGYIQLTGAGITYKNVHNAGGGFTPTTTLSITSNPSNDFVFVNAVASAGGSGTVEFTGPLLILANTAAQITGQITAGGGTAAAPSVITTDAWHTVTPPANVTGTLRYRLMTDKTVMVEAQLTIAAAAAAGTLALITGLAAAYTPSTQQRDAVGFVVNGSPTVAQLAADCGMRWQANTGGSFNILGFTGGAAASGVIEISFNARYSVD